MNKLNNFILVPFFLFTACTAHSAVTHSSLDMNAIRNVELANNVKQNSDAYIYDFAFDQKNELYYVSLKDGKEGQSSNTAPPRIQQRSKISRPVSDYNPYSDNRPDQTKDFADDALKVKNKQKEATKPVETENTTEQNQPVNQKVVPIKNNQPLDQSYISQWGLDKNLKPTNQRNEEESSENNANHNKVEIQQYDSAAQQQLKKLAFSAAEFGEIQTLNAILDLTYEIDIKNHKGDTLLMHAVMHGNIDSVRFLIARGANPNIPNRYGHLPTDIARKSNRLDIANAISESRFINN